MKNYFLASLCHEGVLGGGIVANEESITFRTNKVTVSQKYRNFEMKYSDIQGYTKKWVLLFPVYTITMKTGEGYKFVVFNTRKFQAVLDEKIKG